MTKQTLAAELNSATTAPRAHTGRIAQRIFRSDAKDALPLTIHHERIYILPSSRGMAFICVIAIMLMASINYGLNLGYALCFILIGLFCSCLLATYKNLVQIKFLSIRSKDTFAGSDLVYQIRLTEAAKRHRSSIKLQTSDSINVTDISTSGLTQTELRIANPQRGIHSLGRVTLSSDFPLGLWRGWGYLHTPIHAYVYPQPEKPVVDFVGYNAISGGPLSKRSGEQEYTGLKTYENSDSPSRVAWKRVASGAGWYSKQFEAEAEQREVAIRWADTPSHLNTEQRLARMCSWVVRAKNENIAYSFELPGTKPLALACGIEHFETCLRALAAFDVTTSSTTRAS